MSLPMVPVALIIAFGRKEGAKYLTTVEFLQIIMSVGGAEPVWFGGIPYGPCTKGGGGGGGGGGTMDCLQSTYHTLCM